MEKLAVTSDDVTVNELQDIALMMQQHLGNEPEQSHTEIGAALQRKGAFFGLFPTEIQKEHEALTIEKLHLLCRSRISYFKSTLIFKLKLPESAERFWLPRPTPTCKQSWLVS